MSIKLPHFSALKDVAHELTSFLRGSCVREDDFKYGCCCRSKATSDGPGACTKPNKYDKMLSALADCLEPRSAALCSNVSRMAAPAVTTLSAGRTGMENVVPHERALAAVVVVVEVVVEAAVVGRRR